MKYLQEIEVAHLDATPGELDEAERKLGVTASGDGVVLIDTDTLEDHEDEEITKLIRKALPEGYCGLLYLTR